MSKGPKFEVGDKVVVTENSEYLERDTGKNRYKLGEIGTVIEVEYTNLGYWVDVLFKDYGKNLGFDEKDLKHARIRQNPIAEKVYRNQIDKIEDGWIYLK